MGWQRSIVLVFVLFSWSAMASSGYLTGDDIRKNQIRQNLTFVGKYLLEGKPDNSDTLFVQVPKQHRAIKGFMDFSGSSIQFKGSYEDDKFTIDLRSPFLVKQGFAFTWRSITLSLGFNLFNKPKNYFKIGLNSYGKKFAFELGFKTDKNFQGTQLFDDIRTAIPSESLKHTALTGDVYYIFNGNRFSYPAAFNQSRIQRESAGSIIAAASANYFKTRTLNKNADIPYEGSFGGFTMGIGAGYGYNLVLGNFLFHASVIPTLVILDSNTLTVDGQKTKLSYQFPHFIFTGNLSVVYNRNKFFAALRATFHNCNAGNSNNMVVNYFRANGTLCVGWRF